ncbi:uncharacterized protein MELLADRAFT_107991 [Melampsora larici-populina 98AG31]|uniref:Uncharacterized protein n=1 Tax=Melampsora larici-populina (strain 98AG31 / pathotype 3-4-7) TaxID=747676 RepID=F4RRL7_MELLP|nr:uncharacterized protein MELLADRAFT_107991 [Melampsora larici-populina 98AG31]EGG04999.1 hypothetical protein MELLADRAFT_107991 [Melampsora larici-populina 98AG31]
MSLPTPNSFTQPCPRRGAPPQTSSSATRLNKNLNSIKKAPTMLPSRRKFPSRQFKTINITKTSAQPGLTATSKHTYRPSRKRQIVLLASTSMIPTPIPPGSRFPSVQRANKLYSKASLINAESETSPTTLA